MPRRRTLFPAFSTGFDRQGKADRVGGGKAAPGRYLQSFSRRAASMAVQSPFEQAFSKASQAS